MSVWRMMMWRKLPHRHRWERSLVVDGQVAAWACLRCGRMCRACLESGRSGA